MPSSLVKFSNRTHSAGQRLWWGRSSVDGLPFRGPTAPVLPEDEYEARVVKVSDFRNAFFDVTVPRENKLFCDVMECCGNGWFQLFYLERFWRGTTKHYVEWFEYYLEDGTRTPFLSDKTVELGHVWPPQQREFSLPVTGERNRQ
jgi:hypothetical protein